MPELELLRFSFFLSVRIFKHWVGEKTARIPKMQIELKIEPISGFRHGRFPVTAGGKTVRTAMISKPTNDTGTRKVTSEL